VTKNNKKKQNWTSEVFSEQFFSPGAKYCKNTESNHSAERQCWHCCKGDER